ncbi:MAG: dephospho-CoA kinase [Bacillota bacterium]|nr:dephospho-CoA kinase [Bacillota bacterium]
MKVLGITGGTGSGKSTAAEYLISKGFACVDADQIGRELTAVGQPVLEIIKNELGAVAYDNNASGNGLVLDRKALASAVFTDEKKRIRFDGIIHGEMIKIIDRKIAEFKCRDEYRGILLDAPLLFEAGIDDRCDAVILVTADTETRIRRVVERDGISEEDAVNIINSQMSDEAKIGLADFVVDNSGSTDWLKAQLDEIIAGAGL